MNNLNIILQLISLFWPSIFLLILIIAFTIYPFYHIRTKKIDSYIRDIRKFTLAFINNTIELATIIIVIILSIRLLFSIFNNEFFLDIVRIIKKDEISVLFNYIVNLLQVICIIFLLGTIVLFLRWLSSKAKGTVILPFEDTTNEKFGKKVGQAISDSLSSELHRIWQIYVSYSDILEREEEFIRLETQNLFYPSPISSNQEQLINQLVNVGTLEYGKTKFSIGALLLILKYLWPFGGVERLITGSIQALGSKIRLVVKLESGNEIKIWEVTHENVENGLFPEIIRELAYKLSQFLISNNQQSSWKAFKNYTEAISKFNEYRTNKDFYKLTQQFAELNELCINNSLKQLEESLGYCLQAINHDVYNPDISVFMYYLGASYIEVGKLDIAKKLFTYAMKIDKIYISTLVLQMYT
ncbi:MAG: tetratricopeptide repeat protein [Aulosira sp. ZfuVER01]|nr:hypothetical protein [Aulosira sp. ZfuVER01]MDZ8002130.1 hypothetical protein [Aulosira sp. DedVER01a]MDZ8052603.1 hypothetical protein [Aulosira sp. ZfuCHP01]